MMLYSCPLFCISAAFLCLAVVSGSDISQCKFPNHDLNNIRLKRAFEKLSPIIGKRYPAVDPNGNYTYTVGICTSASTDTGEGIANAGVIQVEKADPDKRVIIGRLDQANIFAGTDWVYLEYRSGKSYGSHCNKEDRKAAIMIVCDLSAPDGGKMAMLEEERDKSSGCYYLFEMNSRDICQTSVSTSLSIGSILVIVFCVLVAMYLLFGFLYQRLVLGAKGMEQIPHYSFWQDFGNLQADGCAFVCRSGSGRREHSYKGVGDDQLEEVEERDDNLLPM